MPTIEDVSLFLRCERYQSGTRNKSAFEKYVLPNSISPADYLAPLASGVPFPNGPEYNEI